MSFVAPATVSMFISGLAYWLSYRTFSHNMNEKKQHPISVADLLKVLDSEFLAEHHLSAKKELDRSLSVLSIRQEVAELGLPREVCDKLMLEHELITEIRKSPRNYFVLKQNGGFTRFTTWRLFLLVSGVVELSFGIFQVISAYIWPSFWQEPTIATVGIGLGFIMMSMATYSMYRDDVKDDLVREYYFLQGLKRLTDKPVVYWKRWHQLIYRFGEKRLNRQLDLQDEFEVKNES